MAIICIHFFQRHTVETQKALVTEYEGNDAMTITKTFAALAAFGSMIVAGNAMAAEHSARGLPVPQVEHSARGLPVPQVAA